MNISMKYMVMLCCFIAFLSIPAFGASPMSLTASIPDLPGWAYLDNDGKPAGIFVDMYQAIAQEMGVTFQFHFVPFARLMKEAKEGGTDVIGIFRFDELQEHVDPTAPTVTVDFYLIGRAGNDLTPADFQQIKRLGFTRGSEAMLTPVLEQYKIQPVLEDVTNFEQLVRKLLADRNDVIAIDNFALSYLAQQLGATRDQFGKPYLLAQNPIWFQFSKHSPNYRPESVEQMRLAMNRLSQQGVFRKMVEQRKLMFPNNQPPSADAGQE